MYVSMYVCMHACMFVCVHVCMCACVCATSRLYSFGYLRDTYTAAYLFLSAYRDHNGRNPCFVLGRLLDAPCPEPMWVSGGSAFYGTALGILHVSCRSWEVLRVLV